MKYPTVFFLTSFIAGIELSSAQDAFEPIELLAPLTVIGDGGDLAELSGSGYLVSGEELKALNTTNINRVLAKVPGVYVREEDGFGNFPNISIRGGDGTRSEKVTMMEDGILTAPAPYSASAAYYSPKVARMSGWRCSKVLAKFNMVRKQLVG